MRAWAWASLLLAGFAPGCFVDETLGDDDEPDSKGDVSTTVDAAGSSGQGMSSVGASDSGPGEADGDDGREDIGEDAGETTGGAQTDAGDGDGSDGTGGETEATGEVEATTTGRTDCGGGGCPLGCEQVEAEDGRQFVLCTQRVWDEARAQCQDFGGDLARIETLQANDFLAGATDLQFGADDGGVWFGLHDRQTEGTFQWLDDEQPYWIDGAPNPGVFAPWNVALGEPNDFGGGEDCGTLRPGDGLWNDAPCGFPRNYICDLP